MKSLTDEFVIFRNNAIQRRRFPGGRGTSNFGDVLPVFRSSSGDDDEAHVVLLRSSDDLELGPDEDVAPPSYVGQCEALQYQMSRLEAKIDQLDGLHKLHASRPTLDEEDREEAEIRAATQDVSSVSEDIH